MYLLKVLSKRKNHTNYKGVGVARANEEFNVQNTAAYGGSKVFHISNIHLCLLVYNLVFSGIKDYSKFNWVWGFVYSLIN